VSYFHSFGLKPLRFKRLRAATLEAVLVRWWRADTRLSSVAGPCAKLKAAIPAAALIIVASPEEFEPDHLPVSANDAWSMRQYGLNASAILLAAWLLMPAEQVGTRELWY